MPFMKQRSVTLGDIKVGNVVRMTFTNLAGKAEEVCYPWSDCIIVSVGDTVTLSRSYARMTAGKVTYHEEVFSTKAERIIGKTTWQVLVDDRGNIQRV